jgi:hypothetical protein
MESAPQQRFTHPTTLCRRENRQLPCFQAIPNSCLPRASKGAHFAKGCKNTEPATLTTFRINTCKSVSKQRTLTPSRINTYKKQGKGGAPALPRLQRPASSTICASLSPVPSLDCAYFPSPRGCTTSTLPISSSPWTFSPPPTTRYPLPATHYSWLE